MTTAISSSDSTAINSAATDSAQAISSTQQLGENDFLNLLVTQLKNQNPLNPVDNQEFVAQLAQFSQLQQSTQQVTLLQQLIAAQTANQQYALLPLLGHQVNVAGSYIELGSGPAMINYGLPVNAASVGLTILNSSNQPVRVLTLGTQQAGMQQVQWDGRDQSGLPLPAGTYQYVVTAVDAAGQPITPVTTSRLTVSGIQANPGQGASLLSGDQAIDPSAVVAIR
ncbi:MAG TPA: flagellar hook capping FlgD N-terminal domain-containing protein [Nitrospira sp.]|nr:flagellar hook capping FlgD N-terminal domain-containing protein [Nitrospira sp.]